MSTNLSALERLPRELKAIIFAAIPDVHSLIAFVLSGRELYDSFLPDEHLFAGKVLANQFKDLHIFEDAALALQARSHPQDLWIPERMESLFSNHEARLAHVLALRKLSEALEWADFHRKVQDIAEDIAARYLTAAEQRYHSQDTTYHEQIMQNELSRIMRALYRFELYCAFYGDKRLKDASSQKLQRDIFWSKYAPWEIEQIACVIEYFYARLIPLFKELGLTFSEWTSFSSIAKVLGDSTEEFLQPQNAHGIANIHKLIFKGPRPSDPTPSVSLVRSDLTHAFDFVVEGLDECMKAGWALDLAEHEQAPHTSAEPGQIAKPPVIQDRDNGPGRIRRSAHQQELTFVLLPSRAELRSCGYVFWDEARLIKCGLMTTLSAEVHLANFLPQSNNEPPTRDERTEWKVKEFIALGRLELFL